MKKSNNTDIHITHIQITLYKNDYHDKKLINRLVRKNGKKFKKKVFTKNEVEYIIQEPDFYKYYKHFNQAKNLEETLDRINSTAFLFVITNIFKRLKKITFFISNRKDTQKIFKDTGSMFSYPYHITKMKIDLRNAFKHDISMNQEVSIQEMIQEFKKFLRNGYYDMKMMKMMTPSLRLTHRAVDLYIIISSLDDEQYKLFEPCINYVLNTISGDRVLSSNPKVTIE